MTVARQAYNELVYGGHLLALGTSSIAASVALILGRTPSWDLLVMAYLFSFAAYTVNRAADFDQDRITHPARTEYLESRKAILPTLAALSFVAGYVLALFRSLEFFVGLLVPLVLAVAYSVSSKKLAGILGISRLKDGLLVKNLAISLGWALIPFLVGLYYSELPVTLLTFAPFIFLRLLVNTIYFDVRDVEADAKYGVRTIPIVLGERKALGLIDLIDFSAATYLIAAILLGLLPWLSIGLALLTPYSVGYRYYARFSAGHDDLVRDVGADGEYVLWGLVTYLGHL